MSDDLPETARDQVAAYQVGLVARYSVDAFQNFSEKSVFRKVLNEIRSQ